MERFKEVFFGIIDWIIHHLPRLRTVNSYIAVAAVLLIWGILWHMFGLWVLVFTMVIMTVLGYMVLVGGDRDDLD